MNWGGRKAGLIVRTPISNRQLCEPAAWFDGFFGDSRAFEETPVGTFVRLRNSLQWDEAEGWSVGVRVRANVLLPRVSERLRLLVHAR